MDPLSLTLTVGPILIKAAKLAKLCQEIQAKIESAPTTLASIITECSAVNHVLFEVQNLGLRDLSFLDVDLRKRFGDEIDNIGVGCTSVLSTIEQHVGEFQNSEGLILGPSRKMGLKDKIKVVWKEDEIQLLLEKLRGYQVTLGNSLKILHMQIGLNTHQLTEMQGTVLTTLLQESREQRRHPRQPAAGQESESVSNRFSVLSTSSDITDTSFAFDQEAMNSNIYRQAFKQRMRNLISFPQKFRGDRTSIQAVASISEDASYFEENIETLEEIPGSDSAEPVITVDNSTTNEGGTLELKNRYSLADIPEDSVPPNRKSTSNNKAEQGLLDSALAAPEVIVQDENLSHTQPQGTSKASLWTRLRRNRIEQSLNNSSKALTSRPKKPSARSSATEKWDLDPKSLYFASADNMIKIVIVGDPGPLKTRLLITYTTGKYPSEYVPTVFDNYSVDVLVGTEKWTLGLWDTAGQEDYDRLRPLSYPQTDLFLICANRSSLREYERAKDMWAPELHHHLPHVPRILVGVQDFEDENTVDRMQYGTKLASEIGAEMYLECDLLTMKGVKELFDEAIATALSRVLTKEELKREKEKEKKARLEAAPRKPMEGIKEDP